MRWWRRVWIAFAPWFWDKLAVYAVVGVSNDYRQASGVKLDESRLTPQCRHQVESAKAFITPHLAQIYSAGRS